MKRPIFHSREEYGRRFTDVGFWRTYVAEVCRRHGLQPAERVRAGLPGTHPVFLVEERWVVKFFSDRFAGAESFAIEREIAGLLAATPEIAAPSLLAAGELFPRSSAWHWPYLVFAFLPGVSLGEAYDQVSSADRELIAISLARWLKALHHAPLNATTILRPIWKPFAAWLAGQRAAAVENHRRWCSLPDVLIEQLEQYLPPADALLDLSRPPLLLHADMNADHLLGELRGGRWVTTGIIDFGDAKVGDFLYELVALHLGLFRGEKHLLRFFLDAYDFTVDDRLDFVRTAMSYALLHEFDVLSDTFLRFPALREAASLPDVAEWLWRLP